MDLVFTFKYVCLNCIIDESVDSKTADKIFHTVKQISEEINIDKSYVEFKENKHEDVFMLEDGWTELCKLVLKTNFGKKATKEENLSLQEAYCMMILCYVYLFLENLGYDTETINLELDVGSKFLVEFQEDTMQEWKRYPGKWQTWNQ